MKRILTIIALALLGLPSLRAQEGKWSAEFGSTHSFLQSNFPNPYLQDHYLDHYITTFEFTLHHEYPLLKWLAADIGFGATVRGGRQDVTNPSGLKLMGNIRVGSLYLPLMLQLKAGRIFWWEIGGELKKPFFTLQKNAQELEQSMRYADVDVAAATGFRLNVSPSSSFGIHLHWGLTPISRIQLYGDQNPYPEYPEKYLQFYDRSLTFSFRYRY